MGPTFASAMSLLVKTGNQVVCLLCAMFRCIFWFVNKNKFGAPVGSKHERDWINWESGRASSTARARQASGHNMLWQYGQRGTAWHDDTLGRCWAGSVQERHTMSVFKVPRRRHALARLHPPKLQSMRSPRRPAMSLSCRATQRPPSSGPAVRVVLDLCRPQPNSQLYHFNMEQGPRKEPQEVKKKRMPGLLTCTDMSGGQRKTKNAPLFLCTLRVLG